MIVLITLKIIQILHPRFVQPGNASLSICNKRHKRQAKGRGRSGKRGRGNNRRKTSKNNKTNKNRNNIPKTTKVTPKKGDVCSNTGMEWNNYHSTSTIHRYVIMNSTIVQFYEAQQQQDSKLREPSKITLSHKRGEGGNQKITKEYRIKFE